MKNNHRSLPQRTISIRPTNAEKLYSLLLDRAWHTTQELVAKVGHTFAVAKWHLSRIGYYIDKRRQASERRSFEYRLGLARKPTTKAPANLPIEGYGKR